METQTSAKQPLWMAGLITQSMSGRPASGLMFFLGIDTEPPRAGIIAITRGLLAVAMLAADAARAGCYPPNVGHMPPEGFVCASHLVRWSHSLL